MLPKLVNHSLSMAIDSETNSVMWKHLQRRMPPADFVQLQEILFNRILLNNSAFLEAI